MAPHLHTLTIVLRAATTRHWIAFAGCLLLVFVLDWAEALVALDRMTLDPQTVADTLGALLKYQDDIGAITPDVAARLVAEAQAVAVHG